MRRRRTQAGNSLVEFTLVGIPVIFTLVATFEIARGMWVYTTMAHAVREGARFAIAHGNNCAIPPTSCRTQVRDIIGRIKEQGVGLLEDEFRDIQLISSTRTITCTTISACLGAGAQATTYWPTSGASAADTPPGPAVDAGGTGDLEVRARYRFRSAIVFFWPGASSWMFGEHWFSASSRENIQY
jgi:hypothetical protein